MKKEKSEILSSLFGLGLRSTHFNHLTDNPHSIAGWFEIISENYFRTQGRPRVILDKLRENYPISCHGVSLSIAGYDDFDWNYLKDLKKFYHEIEPFIISDHLCFTGIKESNLHNLLPFAFNKENLYHLSNRIDQIQNFFGRKMGFENLSAYFDYKHSTMSEWEFISELMKICDCHLLLDLNNVFVNSRNQSFDPYVYLNSIPLERVQEIHLAGFSERDGFYFDTHSNPLYFEELELYKHVLKIRPEIPVLFEWDENIPAFNILENQLTQISRCWDHSR